MKSTTYKKENNALKNTLLIAALFMLVASNVAASQISIFAPAAETVCVKGAHVQLVRNGDYVLVNNQTESINDNNPGDSDDNNGSNEPANQAPTFNSISPNANKGISETFTLRASDANGASTIKDVSLLINTSIDTTSGVMVSVNSLNDTVYLRDTINGNWKKAKIGNGAVLQTSAAKVAVNSVKISGSGSDITVIVPVTFREGISGAQNLYVNVSDAKGASTGWKKGGTYEVLSKNQAPRVLSISSEILNQDITEFTARFEDKDGAADISDVRLVINKKVEAANSIYLSFNPETRQVALRNDLGTGWINTNKRAAILVNKEAKVDSRRVTFIRTGNILTVKVQVEFTGAAELKALYAMVSDGTESSKWAKKGTYNVSELTVADNEEVAKVFAAHFENLDAKYAAKKGLHEINIIKANQITQYSALNGEQMIQAADLQTWNGKSVKVSVNGEKQFATKIDGRAKDISVIRLTGNYDHGSRLVYNYRHANNYQFIEIRRDGKAGQLVLVSGYNSNGKDYVRKEVSVKDKGAKNEMILKINVDKRSIDLDFNGQDVFAGAFKNGVKGGMAMFSQSSELNIVYSLIK